MEAEFLRLMKNSYILLRNNIESSSLLIEDLQQIGLQETDLIWVECQSVCWQAPREISELKKLLSADKPLPVSNKIKNAVENITETIEHFLPIDIPNKLVFVEMPSGKKSNTEKHVAVSNKDPMPDDMNKYGNPETVSNLKTDKKFNSYKSKSDLPFAEIKETFKPHSTKNKNLQETIFGFELPENAKKITLYTGLVLIGALLMLLVMNSDHKNKSVMQPIAQQPEKVIEITESVAAEESTTSLPEVFEEQPYDQIEGPEAIRKETPPSSIKTSKTSDRRIDVIAEDPNPINEVPSKKIPIENISSKVTLKANDFGMGSFGGIKNLEVTLENGSAFLLDKIAVEIIYLNPEGEIVNSDKIYFQSIGPGDTATLPVKKSKRGVKINLKVIKIESKELSDVNSTATDSNNYSKN
ncbi:MAG: hypothetical protein ABIP79_05770 [Chitinophagaceae bacterium]